MLVASAMRKANELYDFTENRVVTRPFADQDICYAEFIDWVKTQPDNVQSAVTLALHLTVAYGIKHIDPIYGKQPTNQDRELVQRVEGCLERLGITDIWK